MSFLKSTILASSALVLATISGAGFAAELVSNGNFESTTLSDKGPFLGHVTDWSGGGNLTFLAFPGTADAPHGATFTVDDPFPATSPHGGNFVMADADAAFSDTFSQTISGLLVGGTYTLTFDQASGQLWGNNGGPTVAQWEVTFGSDTQLSALMNTPAAGSTPWQSQTLTFIATAGTQLLSFLAVGGPAGAPPVAFLDAVSLEGEKVPEPATFALLGLGLIGLGAARRRTRAA